MRYIDRILQMYVVGDRPYNSALYVHLSVPFVYDVIVSSMLK